MINIKVNAIIASNNTLMDVVNTTTYIYSVIKHMDMKYDEDKKELNLFIEYETDDSTFLRIEDIINTNIIVGSELKYLNIDSKKYIEQISMPKIPDKITIPEDADMELKDQTDYYVFGAKIDGKIVFWNGLNITGLIKYNSKYTNAKRFKTALAVLDDFCNKTDTQLVYIGQKYLNGINIDDIDDKVKYFVFHIINDIAISVDYYEEAK